MYTYESLTKDKAIPYILRALSLFCFVLLFIFLLFSFLLQTYDATFESDYVVNDKAMLPTIAEKETVRVTSRFKVDYGDMVLFDDNGDGYNALVARTVVALEGDRVEKRETRIIIHKNNGKSHTIIYDFSKEFGYLGNIMTVGKGEVFVLGENYNQCMDSTDKEFAVVKADDIYLKIIGKKSAFYDWLH